MEDLETQKRIMNLGKSLVNELDLDPGVDTLARWMAHYIARQIEVAENAIGVDKKEAEERCFETILKLWKHRSALPKGIRPLENFESILRTIARLDPENKRHFFFENKSRESDNIPQEVQNWLDISNGIDEAARVWLEYVFEQAAISASDNETTQWLENCAFIEDIDDFTPSIIRKLLNDDLMGDSEEKINQEKREKLISSIKKLEAFTELNQLLLSEFKKELKESL